MSHLSEQLDLHKTTHDAVLDIEDLRIVLFPVQYGPPHFNTLGFAVCHEAKELVYVTDMWEFMENPESTTADLLSVEGSALFRGFGHGEESHLRTAHANADAKGCDIAYLELAPRTNDNPRITTWRNPDWLRTRHELY